MNKFKSAIPPITLFLLLCVSYYFLVVYGIMKKDQNTPQLLLSTSTLCLGLFGMLKVEHWRKDKIRSVIFNDCVTLKKTILRYGLHIQTTTNLVYGKDAMLRTRGNSTVSVTQESLNKANIELYHTLRPELSEMLDNITLYYTLQKYVRKEYKDSLKYLVEFYARYLKSMYYPITENSYSAQFLDVQEYIKTPLWECHVNRVTEADLDMIFTLHNL